MCGRYANHIEAVRGWEGILGKWPKEAAVGFNICPTQLVPVFTKSSSEAMRWGLVPSWSNSISTKYATFNARVETIESKPAFRHACSTFQRCLIPAIGYYEWKIIGNEKQPQFVSLGDGSVMVYAGLYEPAREGSIPASCTIITRAASGEMAELHPRMPVILNRGKAEAWLNDATYKTNELALPEQSPQLTVYPVSKEVNNPRNQGSKLIERVGSEKAI